ncbi:hypothetical protein QBC44DRAFT_124154 [Cladorrhinum sp. PSN332]|nr:hypothetical protein QBC44DRAFT_124154 [Cladorrhinum sp. PSN332]
MPLIVREAGTVYGTARCIFLWCLGSQRGVPSGPSRGYLLLRPSILFREPISRSGRQLAIAPDEIKSAAYRGYVFEPGIWTVPVCRHESQAIEFRRLAYRTRLPTSQVCSSFNWTGASSYLAGGPGLERLSSCRHCTFIARHHTCLNHTKPCQLLILRAKVQKEHIIIVEHGSVGSRHQRREVCLSRCRMTRAVKSGLSGDLAANPAVPASGDERVSLSGILPPTR